MYISHEQCHELSKYCGKTDNASSDSCLEGTYLMWGFQLVQQKLLTIVLILY